MKAVNIGCCATAEPRDKRRPGQHIFAMEASEELRAIQAKVQAAGDRALATFPDAQVARLASLSAGTIDRECEDALRAVDDQADRAADLLRTLKAQLAVPGKRRRKR